MNTSDTPDSAITPDDRRQTDQAPRFNEVDWRLLSPRIGDLTEEMGSRIREAKSKIEHETTRSGEYLSRYLAFLETLINELAERLYAAYCDTWIEQNRSVSPAFIQWVRDGPIRQMFAAQQSGVEHFVANFARQRGEPMNQPALKSFSLRIGQLSNRWSGKLEADAAACGYRLARQVRTSTVPKEIPPSITRSEARKPGRASKLSPDFVVFAGRLWQEATLRRGIKVSHEQLLQIATKLDGKCYLRPTRYLEDKFSKDLKLFNSYNSNSKQGPVKTWTQLVRFADPDHCRRMRRLLSRCASKLVRPAVRN